MKSNIGIQMKKSKATILNFITILFKITPLYSLVYIVQMILSAINPLLILVVSSNFIDVVLKLEKYEFNAKLRQLLFVLFFLIFMKYILEIVGLMISSKIKILVSETMSEEILFKRIKLKYKYIENDESLNMIERVSESPEEKIFESFNAILILISIFIKISGIFYFLIVTAWWSSIVVVICIIPLVFFSLQSGKENYGNIVTNSKIKRVYEYLNKVLMSKECVNERHLFSYTNSINKKWMQNYDSYIRAELATSKKWFIRMKATGVLIFLATGIIIVTIIPSVIAQKMSTGLFISLVNTILSIMQSVTWDLASGIDLITKNKEYLKELKIFFNLDEERKSNIKSVKLENTTFDYIEFKNVWFRYPNCENYILKDFNLKIEKNKSYAVVGANGSGKTTLIKLLLGLYDNFEGEILINSINIKCMDTQTLNSFFAVVFQDFAKYQLSIKDNIYIGNINMMDNSQTQDFHYAIDKANLEEFIEQVGFETKIGKIYEDGIEMSGGEWQKIALARNLVSKAPIRIFDEPTAALDPISENKLYDNYRTLCSDCTSILITHRIGSVKLADEIIVIDEGKVVERGCHKYLYENKKLYYEMYNKQGEWYNEKK